MVQNHWKSLQRVMVYTYVGWESYLESVENTKDELVEEKVAIGILGV